MAETLAFITEHAAPRRRLVDEHMACLRHPSGHRRATFRLQLFAADGQRPVAVVTQRLGEGASVINAAESCAAMVWRTYLPDEPEPPIWIQRFLADDDPDRFDLVTFTVTEDGQLRAPRWRPLSDAEVDQLVGQAVDRDRGSGFTPWPEEQVEDRRRYAAAWVALFPRPEPFRESCMAAGLPWWRRLARQVAPRRDGRDCCWYHGVDWHRVCALAVRLASEAQRGGTAFEDIPGYVRGRAAGLDLSRWEREALDSLLFDTVRPYRPLRDRTLGYNNGQHRAQAMLDAGVRRTLVERD
ncbi:hypothetical protein AB0G03_04520 [Micromonospora aurantiaca]|uniref:hypothetical protein n=1 Tax=Micromonospora aurantiaca (nom. illeg.) TaxID=47850 RepID=UPI0033FF0AC0